MSRPVALVTGAGGGIGGASADALAAAGMQVARTDLPLDVADAGAVAGLVARTEQELGPIEVLVNCAGHLTETPIADITDAEWRRMLRVHLGGTWHTCREVAPRMAARGRGAIVNTSSELALCGAELHAHYCAAKGAIVGLTKSLALELAGRGVRVNAVAPGATDTALLTDTWRTPEYLGSLPLRRLSTPAEIAATVAFLASDAASYVTGIVFSPNSGAVI
ncbi:MAG TPA: SDR family NAD(P)-dependent oxidoreductase [Gaiellales bacterium]|nr:SDR family NAD(P)-dependent oxidoreductase [Gaiellales bacterium]